jgi:dolichol-phosphate mannosyltransferase
MDTSEIKESGSLLSRRRELSGGRLDIVIPLFNESEILDTLLSRVANVFVREELEALGLDSFRCVFVDDGSTDNSAEILAGRIREGYPGLLVRLSRNFGHQEVLSAGLSYADGEVVGIIDADLQDPPEVLLQMVAKLADGYDVVYGVRTNRKESILKRLGYAAFYRFINWISGGQIPRDSGDFCVMRKEVVQAILTLPERLRFVRTLRAWVGFRQVGFSYDRPERAGGVSKYSYGMLYKLATDGLAASSIRPLKVAQVFSILYIMLCALALVVTGGLWWFAKATGPVFWMLCWLSLLMSLTGFAVCFCMYVLSAYVGRMYLETKGRPTFVVMETVSRTPEGENCTAAGPRRGKSR